MSKTTRVIHQTFRPESGAPTCDYYRPADSGLLEARRNDGSFFIAPGLGSVKEDYGQLAIHLAAEGFEVFSPNCNDGLLGSEATSALDRRAEVLVNLIDTLSPDKSRILAHSLGGPVTFRVLKEIGTLENFEDQNHPIESLSFMQPAGFDRQGPADIIHGLRFYLGEALPRGRKLFPSVIKNPKSTLERLNLKQRMAEVTELARLPDGYMTKSVSDAQEVGMPMNFFIGPKDELTRPEPIKRAVVPIVGEHKVHEIHPKAGHLSAQTHSHHMASMIIESLGLSRPDINKNKVA